MHDDDLNGTDLVRREDPAATVGSSALDDLLGFHLRQAQAACNRRFAATFASLELTQKQVAVLWLVADQPGIAQIDLGQRLGMDRATTMALVNRLQDRAYLRREKSPSDGRKQALFLEPDGQAVLHEARRAIREHEAWITGRFTETEVHSLVELLGRLHGQGGK